MSQKRMVCIAVLFLMFFNIFNIARAEEQFGISLDCFEPCKDNILDSSKDIMLVLKINNNLDFWVSIGKENYVDAQSVFRMDVENNNLKDTNFNSQTGRKSESHSELLGKRILIKPKTELLVYIPFDTYNQLSTDNRLGDWKIHPELQINNVEFYNKPFDSKPIPLYYIINGQRNQYLINSPIKGNVLEFKVVKQETKVQVEKSNVIVPEGFLDNLINFINSNLVVAIITTVLGAILAPYFAYKYVTKKGRKKR